MPPLNPFLAAFFKSPIAAQCSPVHHFVLLVPETHVLLTCRETDSGAASVRDVVNTEEFLASHVLRIPPSSAIGLGKDAGHTLRDMKGKAKQFNTLNGRNVIMKDAFIFTNKGFKSTAQAQVVNDATWYPDVFEAKPWLVYYISRPLIGTWEEVKIIPAVLPSPDQPKQLSEKSTAGPSDNSPKKKDIATFHELLNNFPMIARQMQPGLESLFNEFSQVFQKPLPPPPSATEIPDPRPDGPITMAMKRARSNSMSNITTGSQASLPVMEDFFAEDDEDIMRASLETAVTTAIDLFQSVDKQQLSLLGATTDLTGPLVEKLLERYITENIHHMLFSKLASLRRPEDLELEAKIRQMEHVDISQLGLSIDGGLKSKHDLIIQLGPAIEEFKKLSNAMSPQEMLDILLSTMKTASQLSNASASDDINDMPAEKAIMTVNADTLVSLLLYVVIRAQIKNLHARLSYIRNFIFVEDVDSGEMGYALSTFEAVLTYLVSDSAGLRRASRRNKALWDAAKKADMLELRKIMEPTSGQMHVNGAADDDITARDLYGSAPSSRRNSVSWGGLRGSRRPSISLPTDPIASTGSNLSHVFPFQNGGADEDDDTNDFSFRPKIKRVSMETRSLSSMSDISYHSRTASIGTLGSAFEGDISVERLAQTSDSFGESVLMLAVQNQHANVLRYLLSLRGYFPWENVIEDMNNEDTTLLSAAVQLGNMELIEMILDYVMSDATHEQLLQYIRRQDIWGRSVGHYLFNAPSLISRVGKLVPWRQRDKNGQTPLFALCRSYDHADYYDMVEAGMKAARIAQGDDEWLHVDQHVDGKGNTLLHIMSDPRLAFKVLHQSDVDVNAKNEKKFTPLMVASKYGRYDMVRALFADPRVDLAAREARGLTAVELAKDEDVRNKIDDLGLFSMPPADDGRITGVVRGFFVEDGTVRLVLKSAAPTDHDSYTVTTSRRSQGDFEQLARLLAEENPASWIPAVSEMRSPFQLPSKPSRALLRDIQLRSDWFLRIMLNHPSLARHEMLWEFFLVPELQLGAMEQRTNLKVEARRERVRDEFEPVRDLRDVEQFVNHAKESVRSVNHATKSVTRRANSVGLAASDLYDASVLLHRAVSTLTFLPEAHVAGLDMYVSSLAPPMAGPNAVLHSTLMATQSTIQALLSALSRPTAIINHITTARREADRSDAGVGKGARWPLGLLDDTRQRMQDEKEKKALKWRLEADLLSRELRYTQQVVASELAGWQSMHDAMARQAVKDYARGMVLAERMRLQGMQRALRTLREGNPS